MLAHQIFAGSVYVYLIGAIQVEASLDQRPSKQNLWMPVSQLAAAVEDGKNAKGTVPLSTRMLARTLQEFLFGDIAVRITVTGAITCQMKEEAPAETSTSLVCRDRLARRRTDTGKGPADTGRQPSARLSVSGDHEASTSNTVGRQLSQSNGESVGRSETGRPTAGRNFRGKPAEGRGIPRPKCILKDLEQ